MTAPASYHAPQLRIPATCMRGGASKGALQDFAPDLLQPTKAA